MDDIFEGCRVCGFNDIEMWQGGEFPNYSSICPSCNTQAGLEDTKYELIIKRRKEWIADGMPWRSSVELPPKIWDKLTLLKNIPEEFK